MNKILVIGASNIDYSATSKNSIIEGDSNIGSIKISYGGVGRNIVENLARLGVDVSFITFIGNDASGKELVKQLEECNVKVISPVSSYPSSSYLAINNDDGEMKVAICDTKVLDNCQVETFSKYKDIISSFETIVLEANINEEILKWLFTSFPDKKYIVEAVSANKVTRFLDYLDKIYLFKSNLLEAKFLLGKHNEPIILLAKELMSKGVKKVVITQGSAPVIVGENDDVSFITPVPLDKVKNVCGAGDSLLAGTVYGLLKEKPLVEAVAFGVKVSQQTLMCDSPVDKNIGELKELLK